MKRKVLEGARLKECSPEALTLPSLSVNNYNIKVIMRKKKHNLRLITDGSSSVNKENNRDANKDRPLTATLEKPQILDIKFISKIDMSLVKKEFLSITNLCRTPLTIIKVLEKTGHCERPLSLPNCDKIVNIPKLSKRSKTTQSVNNGKIKPITSDTASKKVSIPRTVPIYKKKKNTNDNNNNNDAKFSKIDRRKTTGVNKELIKLPGPCTTCGRPDHPERFHSHPLTPTSSTKTMCESEKVPSKITVQKSTGMKYKSKIDDVKSSENAGADDSSSRVSCSSSGRRPRTLICYLCGREFGTASLPLHEPKCLEKWHRENSSLSSSQQRKPPAKPDVPMSSDKWNQYAWEMCQASLVPCHNCGRTFFPDRLIVHQRGCKNSAVPTKNMMEIKPRIASAPPNSVSCTKCGRLFGSKSLSFMKHVALQKTHIKMKNHLIHYVQILLTG
ncbi:hypothetical protein FQA39_LY03454 [Lamprigera yunnana]|nr:hypothetical protein FQA39_LY03454 [Lamprigera yunnana]